MVKGLLVIWLGRAHAGRARPAHQHTRLVLASRAVLGGSSLSSLSQGL